MNYKEILFATTRILSNNFNCDVFVESDVGNYDNECFVVDIIPILNEAYTHDSNEELLMVSVKYYSNSVLKHYDIANDLKRVFAREINVNGIKIYVSKLEPNFLNDEVGEYLDFLIYTTIYDSIPLSDDDLNGNYPPTDGNEPIKIPIEDMKDINIKQRK